MELVSASALFVAGFFILIKGANYLVNGATSLARYFKISNWFIGLVIVGIGTSIPELAITIASVFNGNSIGLQAIIGSNTFNLLVILGLLALVSPIAIKKIWVKRDLTINVAVILFAGALIIFPLLGDPTLSGVTREEGLAAFLLFLTWVVFMFRQKEAGETNVDYKVFTGLTSFVLITAGIVGVFFGGRWVIAGAETIALSFGLSEALVGLTLVAAGTSLPELTVSIVALFKKRAGIAVGNIIGSNIFDFLGIIGIAALLRPIVVEEMVRFDISAALISALLLFMLILRGKRYVLSRLEGVVMLLAYILYLIIIFWRG